MFPAYPDNGVNWNDYIVADGDTPFSATDSPCDAQPDLPPTQCLHGGELRRVPILDAASCQGLTLVDERDVFTWECLERDGLTFFVSTGFRPGRGLRDLVDEAGWRLNRVLLQGTLVGESVAAAWWDNPVLPLPNNDGSGDAVVHLADEGAIYVVDSDRITQGYAVVARRIAVVTAPGAALWWGGNNVGGCPTPDGIRDCVLAARDVDAVWIEADLQGTGAGAPADKGLVLERVVLGRVHNVAAAASAGDQILLGLSSANRLEHLRLAGGGLYGLRMLDASDANLLRDVHAWSQGEAGVVLDASSRNLVTDLHSANNGQAGVMLLGTSQNRLLRVNANNNGESGLLVEGEGNVLSQVLVAHNEQHGLLIAGTGNVVTALTAARNGATGILATQTAESVFLQLALQDSPVGLSLVGAANTVSGLAGFNAEVLVYLDNADDNGFAGVLLGNAPCYVIGGANPGLVHETCTLSGEDGSQDHASTRSTATYRIRESANSFVALLGTADDVNTSDDSAGRAEVALLDDWTGFADRHRAWGLVDEPGRLPAGPVAIHDWRLRQDDEVLLDRLATGDEPAPRPELDCPPHLHRDGMIIDVPGRFDAFSPDAIELLGDGVGNEDGLCQRDEDCLYTPNFGAYQGDGEARECIVVAGGFRAFYHPENGR